MRTGMNSDTASKYYKLYTTAIAYVLLVILLPNICYADETRNGNKAFVKVENCKSTPYFPGDLDSWVDAHINNPDNLCSDISIECTIKKDGSISDLQLLNCEDQFRKEVLRLIRIMPKWNPAINLKGEPIDCAQYFTIIFKDSDYQKRLEETERAIKNGEILIDFAYCRLYPEFPGGENKLYEWIDENLIFPEDAYGKVTKMRVTTQFVIESDGSISNIEVTRKAPVESLNKEALRLVKSMPKWLPGVETKKPNGQNTYTNVTYILPITFEPK